VPGGFSWRDKTYPSLSAIDLAITGTSWNGPRFFGLRGGKSDTEAQVADPPPSRRIRVPRRADSSVRSAPPQRATRPRAGRKSGHEADDDEDLALRDPQVDRA